MRPFSGNWAPHLRQSPITRYVHSWTISLGCYMDMNMGYEISHKTIFIYVHVLVKHCAHTFGIWILLQHWVNDTTFCNLEPSPFSLVRCTLVVNKHPQKKQIWQIQHRIAVVARLSLFALWCLYCNVMYCIALCCILLYCMMVHLFAWQVAKLFL